MSVRVLVTEREREMVTVSKYGRFIVCENENSWIREQHVNVSSESIATHLQYLFFASFFNCWEL